MSNPGIQILASSPSSPDPEGQFAIFSKVQKVPRVCACADRSGLIKSMQEFGLVKLGIAIAGNASNMVKKIMNYLNG